MPIKFRAPIVEIPEDNEGTFICLAEGPPSDETQYLFIYRKHAFSEEDARVGMDDVHLETCGQGWSWYGHIQSVGLFRNRLRVQLDATASAEMADTGEIEVTFDLAAGDFENLRAALRRAFKERDYYSEPAA